MRLLSTLLLLATAASSTEQPRWAVGISLRDADTSSLWRIGPRFAWGLTLGTNTFTWSTAVDLSYVSLRLRPGRKNVAPLWYYGAGGADIRRVNTGSRALASRKKEPP